MVNLKELIAKDVMITSIKSARLNTTMSVINELLIDFNIHHIPIVDDEGKLKGIVSKHDLDLLKINTGKYGQESLFVKQKRILDTQLAKDVMTTKLVTVTPEDSIKTVVDIFYGNRIHALPVVENEFLVGIITPYDLIRLAYD